MLLFRLTDADDAADASARGPRGLLDFDWFDTQGGKVPSVAQRGLSNGLLMPPSGPEDPLWSLARPGLPQPPFGPRWPFGGFPYPAGSAPFPGYPSIPLPGATPANPTFGVYAPANLPVQAERPLPGSAPLQPPPVRGLASLLMDEDAGVALDATKSATSVLPVQTPDFSGEPNLVLSQSDLTKSRSNPVMPGQDPIVDGIERTFRDLAKRGRSLGLIEAPADVEHFLGATGEPRIIDRDRARQFAPILDAQNFNELRQEGAFLNPKRFANRLLNLGDGQSERFEDEFNRAYGDWDFLKQVLDPETRDFALAFGNTQLKSNGDFTATRVGDEIHIEGTVAHNWSDDYDFHPERYFGLGGIMAKDAAILEKHGRAKPFARTSSWPRRVTGKIRIENGVLKDPVFEWEDIDQ